MTFAKNPRLTELRKAWPEWMAAALLVAALTAGTFFQGIDGGPLILAQTALVLCLAVVVWRSYSGEWKIALTGLTVSVALYWIWLGLTILWSRAPYYSNYLFWWMGSLPLAFWLATLAWRLNAVRIWIATAVVILAVALALAGIVEFHLRGTGPQVMFYNKHSFAGLLNIVAIPTAAYLTLLLSGSKPSRHRAWWVGIAVLLLTYAVGLTQGRGPMISLGLGTLIVGVVLARHVPWRALCITVCIVGVAVAISQAGTTEQTAVGRLAQVADTQGSVWQRWLIWRSSWDLLAESPWWGIGLGVYALAWQRFRHPDDSSSGFLAHNDYLQIWIEAGLPGLLLFVAVLVAASWAFVRVLKSARHRTDVRAEAAGLYGGIFAVSIHSLVDFNFYVLPTLILCGLMLARLAALRAQLEVLPVWQIRPSRWLTPYGYRALVVLIFAFPLLYFLSLTLSVYQTRQGIAHAKAGRLDQAEASFLRAARLNPAGDDILMSQADLYRHVLTLLPASADVQRRELFRLASGLLDEALSLNPLRVQTHVVRAQLLVQNPDLTGDDANAKTRRAFEQAIDLNPRAFEARLKYAEYLLSRGSNDAARAVLEDGLRYAHTMHRGLVPYYKLAAQLRRNAGDLAGAQALVERMRSTPGANPGGT